ncbi:MAG TPA: response regulator transcription factor [Candidatus Limnocylindrales bacterium]|nr:response regulator transcription factor [Candidatus Limnocylindrales bacterium]
MTAPSHAAPAPLRVLVVDPDDRIRESLARLLPIGGRCIVVGSAGDSARAVELATEIAPDVIILDCRLPEDGFGGSLVDRLREVTPASRIVVLNWTTADRPTPALDGADAYIRKTFRPHELIDAVVNAARSSVA